MFLQIGLLFVVVVGTWASPVARAPDTVRQGSLADIEALAPFSQFARATYCSKKKLHGWNCGEACAANPTFKPTLVDGDGDIVQTHFVGFWPERSAVVVAHEGTDPTKFFAVMTDLQIPTAQVQTIVFGSPRVGNEQFARFVDSKVPNLTRVNNKRDPIPVLPPRYLGFKHPEGELHFYKQGSAVHCDGQDNDTDSVCSDRTVHEPILLIGNVLDHLGPYEGISMGTIYCH